MTILCLGYPDLLLPDDELEAVVEPLPPAVPDSAKIARFHNFAGTVRDTSTALRGLGLEPTYVDIRAHRGFERVVDLNEPVAGQWPGHPRFDVVADLGTLEHCFNVGQAFRNVAELVKPGGYVLHANPLNKINHGFWSLSPTTIWDFWTGQGGRVEEMCVVNSNINKPDRYDYPNLNVVRIRLADEANLVTLVRLPVTFQPGTGWPLQGKYKG